MMRKKRKTAEPELVGDPGESTHDKISRIIDEVLSGTGPRKVKALPLLPRTTGNNRQSESAVSRALVAAMGRVSYAAIILGLTPETLRGRIRKSETLMSLQEEIREFRLDIAEEKLDKRVMMDRWPAIQFVLETQGKNRGYTKRTEMTGADGNRLVFEFSDGKQHD